MILNHNQFITALKGVFGALFIAAGALHFWKTDEYLKAMPLYVPWPPALVLLSGAASVVLGIALFVPRVSRVAAWGIIAFLVAVFPANLHMAVHQEIFPKIPAGLLWLRLPFQAVLIYWAYRYTL